MISRFLEYLQVERRYSAYTISEYERDLQEFCSFLQVEPQALNPEAVTLDDVRSWMVQLLDRGLSPRSVRRKLSALKSYFKYLLRIGQLSKDVTRGIIAPKMDKPLPVFFEEQQMEAATSELDAADDFRSMRDNIIIEMLYETGMRQAEILGLNDGDIDLSQQQIRVFGKRRKERIVPFGNHLADLIRRYQDMRNETFNLVTAAQQPFLLSVKGVRLSHNTLYTIVRTRMSEVSSQKKRSPHVLRHTFATTMLNEGADINSIKTLLGHASLAATQVYTHTTFEQLRDSYCKAHPRARGKDQTD